MHRPRHPDRVWACSQTGTRVELPNRRRIRLAQGMATTRPTPLCPGACLPIRIRRTTIPRHPVAVRRNYRTGTAAYAYSGQLTRGPRRRQCANPIDPHHQQFPSTTSVATRSYRGFGIRPRTRWDSLGPREDSSNAHPASGGPEHSQSSRKTSSSSN
jgi:hypothetical protein